MNRIPAKTAPIKSLFAASVLVLATACLTEDNAIEACTNSAGCPEERPYCDPNLGGCVPCQGNAECDTRPETPACNVQSGQCVPCIDNAQCSGDTPFCNTETFTCVGCLSDDDCAEASAARCDPATQMCARCTNDTQCRNIEGSSLCSVGDCVECTVQDESPCGQDSCDPATETCTETERGSVNVCGPCVADSECGDGMGEESEDHRCIPLNFMGTPQGGRCLQLTAPSCSRPYTSIVAAVSLSGAERADYCGIEENLTTCEAVRAASGGRECPDDDATECAPFGALCETIGTAENQCTYPCVGDVQCPAGKPACPGGFCTTATR